MTRIKLQTLCFAISTIILLDALIVKDPPYGQLKITGKYLTKLDGTPVQLRGISLFRTNTVRGHLFFVNSTVNIVKCYWNANVIRAPLGIDLPGNASANASLPGYLTSPEENYQRLKIIIESAIENGIYVIVDWHAFHMYTDQAVAFFTNISIAYGGYPHIIYETYNEPDGANTWEQLKSYHINVINAIRANDPDNVIVVGTPGADFGVEIAAHDPINMTNIAYSLHYYTNEDPQGRMNNTIEAINMGLSIFVTESGVCSSRGNGTVNVNVTQAWWNLLDENKISFLEFALADYYENCLAFLQYPTPPEQAGNSSRYTEGGIFVSKKLWSTDQGLVCTAG